MKLILPKIKKPKLPKGKVSVHWVHSRNMYQGYVGGKYLYGASGSTEQEAIEEMEFGYEN